MTSTTRIRTTGLGLFAALTLALAACSGSDVEHEYPRSGPGGRPIYGEPESIFGKDGLTLFQSGGSGSGSGSQVSSIGVNSFLWRASLDTVAFMPIKSADPFGGVIITEWYTPPDVADERFRVNVFILDRTLRSDGIRATVFRQQRDAGGAWIDAKADAQLDTQLEDAILTRARQLRVRAAQQ